MFKIRMGRCCNQEIVITHLKRKVYKRGGDRTERTNRDGDWGGRRGEGARGVTISSGMIAH